MNFRTRFGKWVVMACMGALAACTGQDDGGTVGGDQINIIFPNGTLGPFEAARVTALVACSGIPNDFFGEDPSEQTIFETDLELVNDSPTTGMVFQTITDVVGNCQVDVSVFEPDGELFCVGTGFALGLLPGDTQTVNIVLICDVSQNIDTAQFDILVDTFTVSVGNFCAMAHSMETIPEIIPIVPPPLQIPNPFFDGSMSCGGNDDCVGTCGLSGQPLCDPVTNATEFQLCALDTADVDPATQTLSSCGNRCDNGDPGNLSYQCTATLPDGTASQGTFSDPANGGIGQDFDSDPTTYNGWCSNAAIAPAALPPSVGFFTCSDQEPGVTVTIKCCGGDGDEDCDKCLQADTTCAGSNMCSPLPPECVDDDPTDCLAPAPCEPSTGLCPIGPAREGLSCDFATAAGVCEDGACVDALLCAGVDCDANSTDCVNGGTCDPFDGQCKGGTDVTPGTPCDTPASGPGVCGSTPDNGVCIGNCTGVDCDDTNQCTTDSCDPSTAPGTCVNTPVGAGSPCDNTSPGTCSTASCQCDDAGMCEDVPLGMCIPGFGNAADDCFVPNLGPRSDSNLTGIEEKCVIKSAPDVSGTMVLTAAGTDVWDVEITQNLMFAIETTVALGPIQVNVEIPTNSTTVLTGTADGPVPGTIVLRDLADPTFNINASATGTVFCCASSFSPPVCDSPVGGDFGPSVCPLANLAVGPNTLPLPGDPNARTLPAINANGAWDLGGGSSVASGWYLVNPSPLAGNGTQFAALGGVQTSPGNFDLSASTFKAYNSLLISNTVGECDANSDTPGSACSGSDDDDSCPPNAP